MRERERERERERGGGGKKEAIFRIDVLYSYIKNGVCVYDHKHNYANDESYILHGYMRFRKLQLRSCSFVRRRIRFNFKYYGNYYIW